jgi:hypothetical protein
VQQFPAKARLEAWYAAEFPRKKKERDVLLDRRASANLVAELR